MKAYASLAAILAVSSLAAPAQGTAAPSFTVADVHVSPVRLHPSIHGNIHGDRVVLRDATIADLISFAYKVDPSDIYGGPTWIAFDRFDINATRARMSTTTAASQLLRGLLAERFHLAAHTDTRPLPAFVLSLGKANKMKAAADATDNSGCQYQRQTANAADSEKGMTRFTCHNTTMASFADFLHDVASPWLNRPVTDKTGLKGGWDFEIKWTYNKPSDGNGTSIFDAVDKQLGLKLESSREPTPVVVIDSLNEKPTPNVADIDKILPPPPPASFDVAVIRQANPTEKNFNIDVQGHRVSILFATLQTLIYKSYNINPGLIDNKPKWLDDVHWDVIGTVAPAKPGEGPDMDIDDVNEMVRSLLADRFKLVTHPGSKPSAVYALLADNPKIKKAADPASPPSCKEGPGADGKDPRVNNPLLNRLISCQNMTMAEFASELRTLAGGYVPAPVIDSSGLTGGYDFTLSFSKKQNLRDVAASPAASPAASTDGAASDPGTGAVAISLFDAIQKQLGLKLEKKDSVPVATLVIDHIEQNPTDN
ncbi:MAG TPA: TIGR03435 family protein [Acidobacteriaceae bacterium]|nr:TIGR03435 family protein [Acidobacteriaceae bacterium]